MANTTVSTLNRSANDRLIGVQRNLETPSDSTFSYLTYAPFGFTLSAIKVKLASGTCSLAIQINGVTVTGLSAISCSSSLVTGTATALNTVNQGDRITMVVSSSSSPTKFEATILGSRTGSEGV